ncbi:MAG: hypothetical protein OEW11_00990 [Nitrospirota bacterium]|nr:hypothetical protein [Nitrospirota bacterium]
MGRIIGQTHPACHTESPRLARRWAAPLRALAAAMLLSACGSGGSGAVPVNPPGPPPPGTPLVDKRGDYLVAGLPTPLLTCNPAAPASSWTAVLDGTKVTVPFQLGGQITMAGDLSLTVTVGANAPPEILPLGSVSGVVESAGGALLASFPVTPVALSPLALAVTLHMNNGAMAVDVTGGGCTLGTSLTYTAPSTPFANVPPAAKAPVLSVIATNGAAVTGNLFTLAFDDPDGGPVPPFFAVVSPPTIGALTIDANTGAFTYNPQGTSASTTSFQVSFNDGAATAIATVAVTNNGAGTTNNPPVGNDQHYPVPTDVPVSTFPLPATDPNGTPLTCVITTPATKGVAVCDPLVVGGPFFTYTPNSLGATGVDEFWFTVSDGVFTAGPFKVSITLALPDARGTYWLGAQSGSVQATTLGATWSLTLSGNMVSDYQFDAVAHLTANLTATATDTNTAAPQATRVGIGTDTTFNATVGYTGGAAGPNIQTSPPSLLTLPALSGFSATYYGATLNPSGTATTAFFGFAFSGGTLFFPYTFTPHVNVAPVAAASPAFTTAALVAYGGNLIPLAFTDPDGGNAPYFEVRTVPASGTLVLDQPLPGSFTGNFTYTPTSTGTDSFTVFYHDGKAGATATVAVTNN